MIVVIVGPTAIGKTRLGVAVAKAFNTEVISGDSMQIYRDLDIGTAKVTEAETNGVKHHMIDILDADASFSVADYQREVRHKIEQFKQKHKLPLIVGGTGFYIKTVLHDFDFRDAARNENFAKQYDHLDNTTVHAKLVAFDSHAAQNVHPNNRKRVLRMLEMAMQGEKPSDKRAQDKAVYDYLIIGLTCARKVLHTRINARVDYMVANGLIEEARMLYEKAPHAQSAMGIGYKELFGYFDGRYSLETAIDVIKRNTRQFAKRQYTYFNNQFNVQWFDVDLEDFGNTIESVIDAMRKKKRDE